MGIFGPCYSSTTELGSVEIAVIETYDEDDARASSPGFDDVFRVPLKADGDDDGIGELNRPGTEINVNAIVTFRRNEEHRHSPAGNDPISDLTLEVTKAHLESLGLLVSGVCGIRPNDRLLRIQSPSGSIRWNFEANGRDGLYCKEVRPGDTGSGIFFFVFERRQVASR